jgi:hypothetical protein
MNKTIKTIAIVFLIFGALALVGGAVFGLAGRPGLAGSIPPQNRQNLPQPGSGWENRGQRDGMLPFSRHGFFSLPIWLMGGGLTFLIAGMVLAIFNHKFSNVVDGAEKKVEKSAPSTKKPAQTKKSANKKTIRKA